MHSHIPLSSRLRMAASAMALVIGLFTYADASAQSAPPSPGPDRPQEVVVTGIRKSLLNAVQTKRKADSIVDAISAEDMGAFPDQNIAESLQRVTGVQIQRDRGEGRDISIRGLDPKFAHVTLNGDGLMSISGAGINTTAPAPNRSFDFTTLSSQFVGALVVYKTPTADIEEGGLAGSVDVRTLRPLDLRKRRLVLDVEAVDNSYVSRTGSHITAMYADQFFGRKLGVALGYEYSKRYMNTQSYQSSGQDSRAENQLRGLGKPVAYTNTGAVASGPYLDWNGDGDNLDAYRFNHLVQFQDDEGTRERTTFNIGLQWRPTEHLELRFDGIAGHYESLFLSAAETFQAHLGYNPKLTGNLVAADHISSIAPFAGDTSVTGKTTCPAATPPGACTTAGAGTLPVAGLIDYYDLRGGLADNYTKTSNQTTDLINYQLAGIYRLNHFTIEAQAGINQSKKIWGNYGIDGFSFKELVYDQRTDLAGIPTMAYGAGSNVLTASTYYTGGSMFTGQLTPQSVGNKLGALDITWHDIGIQWLTQLKAGYKYSDMRVHQGNAGLNALAGSVDSTGCHQGNVSALTGDMPVANNPGDNGCGFALTNWMTTFGGSDFLSRYNRGSAFPRTWIGPDTRRFLAKFPLQTLEALPGAVTSNPANIWTVKEINQAAYVRADFSFLGGDLTGNVGVRAFTTRQSGAATTGDLNTLVQLNTSTLVYGSATAAVINHNAYSSALPSLNVRYALAPDKIIRFGAARTITRPDLANLVPGNGSISFTTQTATIANTDLKPYYADNYDASGEWYLSNEALVSMDVFYKYIRGYYVSSSSIVNVTYKDLNGINQPLTLQAKTAVNGSATSTRGVEISYQQPLTMLPAPLDGLGVIFNYTRTKAGGIQTAPTSPKYPLPFVSRDALNAVLYYEKDKVSARFAYDWRGAYVETAGGVGGDARGGSYVKDLGFLDFSSKYQINTHVSLSLDGTNLLDTPTMRVNIYGFGHGYEVNGRTWTIGVRYVY